MQNQDTQTQIDSLNKQIKYLERISIQESFDPTTYLYLTKAITAIATVVINTILATKPTSTYSTSSPSGTAVAGSTWYKDTGVLATREIHVYSGSAWIQFK